MEGREKYGEVREKEVEASFHNKEARLSVIFLTE